MEGGGQAGPTLRPSPAPTYHSQPQVCRLAGTADQGSLMESRRSPPGGSAVAATAPHLLALATLPPASLFSQGLRGAGPPFPRPAEGRQAPDGVMRTGQPVPSVPPTSPQSSAPPPPFPPPAPAASPALLA